MEFISTDIVKQCVKVHGPHVLICNVLSISPYLFISNTLVSESILS